MARYRRMSAHTVTFRNPGARRGHEVVFSRQVASAATKAARRRRGHSLARQFGFVSKGGVLYRKSPHKSNPGGTKLVFVRRLK